MRLTRLKEGVDMTQESKTFWPKMFKDFLTWLHWTLVLVGIAGSVVFVRVNFFHDDLEVDMVDIPRLNRK